MKTKKSKIIAILTIITSILGLILFALQTKFQNLYFGNYIFISFLIIGTISGIFMLKNQVWAFYLGIFYYTLQTVAFQTKKLYFNFLSGLHLTFGWGNIDHKSGFVENVNINIFAIIMLILIITILLKKDEDNDMPFHIRNTQTSIKS
jgi:hypothetical protein